MLEMITSINLTEILIALIGAYVAYTQNKASKDKKISDQMAEERKTESRLLMKMMNANNELTECIALNQINGDDTLCNVQQAMQKVKDARHEYEDFLEKIKAERLVK